MRQLTCPMAGLVLPCSFLCSRRFTQSTRGELHRTTVISVAEVRHDSLAGRLFGAVPEPCTLEQ